MIVTVDLWVQQHLPSHSQVFVQREIYIRKWPFKLSSTLTITGGHIAALIRLHKEQGQRERRRAFTPTPSPPSSFFFLLLFQLSRWTRAETLATRATEVWWNQCSKINCKTAKWALLVQEYHLRNVTYLVVVTNINGISVVNSCNPFHCWVVTATTVVTFNINKLVWSTIGRTAPITASVRDKKMHHAHVS